MLTDFLLNLAAGLTQALFEISADELSRKIVDPQEDAMRRVYRRAFGAMVDEAAQVLREETHEVSEADLEIVGEVLKEYVSLAAVRDILSDHALTKRSLDMERMSRHFRTVRGPERLGSVPFDLERMLVTFQAILTKALDEEIGRDGSPLHNWWEVGTQRDLQARHQKLESGLERIEARLSELAVQDVGGTPSAGPSSALTVYLRHWFRKEWTKVNLADLSERDERVSLLDVYVPLPVDFTIVVQTKGGQVEDWWAKDEREQLVESAAAEEAMLAGEEGERLRPKVRNWPTLRVEEEQLQRIVDGIQAKIRERTEKEPTQDGNHEWYMEAHDAASVQPRFVLVGDPGSGKSSFVRHLALCLAGEIRRRAGDDDVPQNASLKALRDWLLDAYTPIYIELYDLVEKVFPPLPANERQPLPLPGVEQFWRYVHDHILPAGTEGFQPELDALLREGRAIVLLDGLDEVGLAVDPKRRRQIKAFVAALVETFPRARFIVTSRPQAYRRGEWELDGFGRAELRLLKESRIRELATALFAVVSGEQAEAEADAFVKALDRRRVPEDMRGTPLFFTLLTSLWLRSVKDEDADTARDLPTTRGALYRQSVDLLLDKWTHRRPPAQSLAKQIGCTPEQLRTMLEILACGIYGRGEQQGETVIFERKELLDVLYEVHGLAPPAHVLDYLERQAGILISPDNGRFRFVHWSFQEHLAACELLHRRADERTPPVSADRLFPEGLAARVRRQPELWSNVARLAADELTCQERAGDLAELLAAWLQPYVIGGADPAAASLAVGVASEEGLVHPPSQPYDPQAGLLNLMRDAAENLLADLALSPGQRNQAGRALAVLGDFRPGVGLKEGLPDIDWVNVPAGEFIMGSDKAKDSMAQDDEAPQHEVYLDAFRIAKYPVTNGQYAQFVQATDHRPPDHWRGKAPSRELLNHPVVNVSWQDAVAYCAWLSEVRGEKVRMPTEAEWEKAARGTDGRRYPWGDEPDPNRANYDKSGVGATSPVGCFPGGASSYGCEDMAGNVWEWTSSLYKPYPNDADDGREDPEGDGARTLRGGSFWVGVRYVRCAYRFRYDPDYGVGYGFRVVVSSPGF